MVGAHSDFSESSQTEGAIVEVGLKKLTSTGESCPTPLLGVCIFLQRVLKISLCGNICRQTCRCESLAGVVYALIS